jgi:signal transduction histidine kinase
MKDTLENIYAASLKFLEPLTVEKTCEIIVKEALSLAHAEYGSVFLYEKGQLKRAFTTTSEFKKIIPRKDGTIYTVFKSKKALVVDIDDLKEVHPHLKKIGVGSMILIPLLYKDKAIGVLSLQSYENSNFSDHELNLLKVYGSLASMAIKKNQQYDSATRAIELRDMFMSMASHELRTPITVINGYIQMLYKKLHGTKGPEAVWIDRLYTENSRLINLVKELLEVNRIRSGQIQYFWTEIPINSVCNDAIEQFKINFPSRSIQFIDSLQSKNAVIIGDKEKLVQMVISVLDNAVKFSDMDSEITLELAYKSPHYSIVISDHGIGISKGDIDQIFESFYRDEVNKNDGIGIGLYLVKNIIEQHHGTISLKSKVNSGTTVTIKLPEIKS